MGYYDVTITPSLLPLSRVCHVMGHSSRKFDIGRFFT